MARSFVKDDGRSLPVDDRFLLPFVSPTAPGTMMRESAPAADLNDRQLGRILLQIHQVLSLFASFGIDLAGRSLLDIGTGNGMVPCLLLELSDLESAVGADPFLDGEHTTSWQPHDQNKAIAELRDFVARQSPDRLDHAAYGKLLDYENYSLIPTPVPLTPQGPKQYRFAQVGAHECDAIDQRFDLFYCKAIEHIPDWDGIFRSMSAAANPGAVAYFKHRSFFSFLGPHRYATVNIPWGHVLLTDDEYRRFVREEYPDDAEKMIDFYFRGLAYPRTTVSDMLRIARDHAFVPVAVLSEPTRYIEQVRPFIDEVDGFWEITADNFPQLGAEELFSGMYHILLRRVT